MRFLFLFLIPFLATSQLSDPAYEDFKEIESLEEYTESKSFYVVNLKMTASTPGMATLTWEAHKSLTKFMVELYDGSTGELFHRKLYRSNSIEIPASAGATVMPIYNKLRGKPKSTNLKASQAKANDIKRREFNRAMKELQENNYNNNQAQDKEIPWRWIFRGIGLIALVVGLIARFASKSEFKDYERRDRRR